MMGLIKIPEERLKIFKEKDYSRKLKMLTNCNININEEISIECEDPFLLMRLKEVIKAFGRGFDFEDALNLLDEEYCLETINIQDFSGKSKNRMIVVKGRVIGRKGKAKKLIEKYTNVKIAIYGKTVSIIGKWEDVQKAKRAVESLLQGRKHGTVFRKLADEQYG
ncbi:MAG: KH domain-containing protein [Candidatus Aenigmatarchaeota archaeon]